MTQRILVLGATGSFGGAVAREWLARGRPVRAVVRDCAKARRLFGDSPGLELVEGDVQDAPSVIAAARDCEGIVHGVNYPYDQWFPAMETATRNVIAAAKASGAAILFPGNVYGFGRQTDRPFKEDAAMRPCSRKGALRVRLEDDLAAAGGEGVRSIVLRAGNYFGPTARNPLVDWLFGAAAEGRSMTYFGKAAVPQQWAYLPDLARVAADLLGRRGGMGAFEVFHFAGHGFDRVGDFYREIALQAGKPKLRLRRLPWTLVRLIGLFDPVVREVMEMRYLWDESVLMDDGKLRHLIPDLRPTPLARAIGETLASYAPSPMTSTPSGPPKISVEARPMNRP